MADADSGVPFDSAGVRVEVEAVRLGQLRQLAAEDGEGECQDLSENRKINIANCNFNLT